MATTDAIDGIIIPTFSTFPISCPPLFQVGVLGELWVAYFTIGGNLVMQLLALAGQWYIIPVGLQVHNGIFDIMPVIVVLMVDASTGALQPQWVSGNGVFQPAPPHMVSTVHQTPNFPPKKDETMGSEYFAKKVESKLPIGKEMTKLNMNVGTSKATMRQANEPTIVEKEKQPHLKLLSINPDSTLGEKQPEPKQKGVYKEDEDALGEVDDFPELALLPKEWTY